MSLAELVVKLSQPADRAAKISEGRNFRQRPFVAYDTIILPTSGTARSRRQSPHSVVLNQGLTNKAANSSRTRHRHNSLEQRRAYPAPLHLVRHGYRYVRRICDLFQAKASYEAQRLCFVALSV
jgi:hypothetical protein